MVTERENVIRIILFHIKGEGAFSKLKNGCNLCEPEWKEFRENLKKLKSLWGDDLVVEKRVVKALFDFGRVFSLEAKKCFGKDYHKPVWRFMPETFRSSLFNFDESRSKGEKITKEEVSAEHPLVLFQKSELSEQEAERAICYHGSEYGAYWRLRDERKFVQECWKEMIFAIRELKRYWRKKEMINRWVAASLSDLPDAVEGHVGLFKEENQISSDIKLVANMVALLVVEIDELLSD